MAETYIVYWQLFACVVSVICKWINDPRAALWWLGLLKSWTIGSASFLLLLVRLKSLFAASKVCALKSFPSLGEFRFPVGFISDPASHSPPPRAPPGLEHCPWSTALLWTYSGMQECLFLLPRPLSPGISQTISTSEGACSHTFTEDPSPFTFIPPPFTQSSDRFFSLFFFPLEKKKKKQTDEK